MLSIDDLLSAVPPRSAVRTPCTALLLQEVWAGTVWVPGSQLAAVHAHVLPEGRAPSLFFKASQVAPWLRFHFQGLPKLCIV